MLAELREKVQSQFAPVLDRSNPRFVESGQLDSVLEQRSLRAEESDGASEDSVQAARFEN